MAYSQSIRRAQTPKTCELCEATTEIKWTCRQCQTFICDKCKEIHLKVQTSIEHEIVDIKSSGGLIDVQPTVICTDNIRAKFTKVSLVVCFAELVTCWCAPIVFLVLTRSII